MDSITDMLNRIKNSQSAGHQAVEFPYSKIKFEIAKTFEREGFVDKVEKYGRGIQKMIKLELKYVDRQPAIMGIKRLSKPGQRRYVSRKAVPSVNYGRGFVLLSTPGGLMTDREARKKKVGGEVLLEIW